MRKHLTPSTFIAIAALFIALGGTSYAVSKLPSNSVGSKQIKKNAVNSKKVKDKSLLAKDFKPGQLPSGAKGATGATGPAGATGVTGAVGAAGSALAFAYVEDTGTVNVPEEKAKGITSAMVARPATGIYCFELSAVGPVKNVSAIAEPNYGNLAESDKFASAQVIEDDDFGFGCPNDSDAVVVTRDISTGNALNWFFYVTFN